MKGIFWWKKLSSNSSNCEVVELVWIWHSNQLGMNAFLEFFYLTWRMFPLCHECQEGSRRSRVCI